MACAVCMARHLILCCQAVYFVSPSGQWMLLTMVFAAERAVWRDLPGWPVCHWGSGLHGTAWGQSSGLEFSAGGPGVCQSGCPSLRAACRARPAVRGAGPEPCLYPCQLQRCVPGALRGYLPQGLEAVLCVCGIESVDHASTHASFSAALSVPQLAVMPCACLG